MPSTPKLIPYPLSTEPPNVPADLQRLAEDLDFTKIPLLTAAQITSSGASINAYPLGISMLSLSTTESGAGGWPSGGSGHVLTVKPNTGRAAQWFFRNGNAALAYYRNLITDPGPHPQWVLTASEPSAAQAVVAASGHASSGYSRLEADGRTVRLFGAITKTAAPIVRGVTIGTIAAAHRPLSQIRVSLALGTAASGPAASGAIIEANGTIVLTADTASLGTQSIAYLDAVTYPVATPLSPLP